MMRKDIGEIINYCISRKISPEMNSVGFLIPQNIALIKKLDLLKLSLDGPEKVHDLIRDKRGFLVLFDTFYPGWKAYIDNNLTKIYRTDYLFRALYIDKPGVHAISFIYSPFSFRLGAAITLTTLICSIGGILWIGKRPQVENARSGNV